MRPHCLPEHNALSCRWMCPKTSLNNRSSQFYAFIAILSNLSSFLLMVGKFKLGIWAACPTTQLRFGREPRAQECHSEPIHLWGTHKTPHFWVSGITQKTSKICWLSSLRLFFMGIYPPQVSTAFRMLIKDVNINHILTLQTDLGKNIISYPKLCCWLFTVPFSELISVIRWVILLVSQSGFLNILVFWFLHCSCWIQWQLCYWFQTAWQESAHFHTDFPCLGIHLSWCQNISCRNKKSILEKRC